MYKRLTYGLRTLALAAIAGCGSTPSKLEANLQEGSVPFKISPAEAIDSDYADLQHAKMMQDMHDYDSSQREKLLAERDRYKERFEAEQNSANWHRKQLLDTLKKTVYNPENAIIVGDQASGSDTIGAVDIPQRFSREPLIPPYEFPWKTYASITLGLLGAYLIGYIRGERKERKKARGMIDGLVDKFGMPRRSVGDLLRTPPPN